mmetsp:Transcript_26691/g.50592  ORF Transcript_26691/g.50592 Transcript_26691/m.50592 type:complete len:616 (-) Transcript_26691:170-2017(-)|eukprot:CAMPEP_0182491902 /NCGR_PEP_ID=MMETSP1321-20130603/1184_1 /TAXON_ID=91990 /ORGANISM="Bolidomonas sp., Strain RCC1657" /LENGTH=615 /DNA_ID=CAMNT_0024694259 /DNA_START=2128 /DNA_END=3975 /DNA_ORIENTATION=-
MKVLSLLPLLSLLTPTAALHKCHEKCIAQSRLCLSSIASQTSPSRSCKRTSALCRDSCRDEGFTDKPKGLPDPLPFPSSLDPGSILFNHEGSNGLSSVGPSGEILPILPFGYYQYTIDEPHDVSLSTEEVIHGMSLTAPYVSTSSPDEKWFEDMDEFLDGALSLNFYVHFQLIAFEDLDNSDEVMANLTKQVEHFKGHPAVFGWYLADEPDGGGIEPNLLQPKYDLIRSLDATRPVSMVFCAGGASNYLSMLDLIMVDPYPIPGSHAATVDDTLKSVAELGKPIMMVPQAFGGGENWYRTPSIREERLMTYLGLLNDVVAIQYFVRSALQFPYAPNAWNEIRKISGEVVVLTSALSGGTRIEDVAVDNEDISVGAWTDRDDSVVLIVANIGQDGLKSSGMFTVDVPFANADSVISQFEDSESVEFSSNGKEVTIKDYLRNYDTRVYRLQKKQDDAADDDNMVYNPSYDVAVCPGVVDGNYVDPGSDEGATFAQDGRVSTDGRNSLRLSNPAAGAGVSLSPYTIPALDGKSKFKFSVNLKGAVGGEEVTFSFTDTIFDVDGAQVVKIAEGGEWQTFSMTLTTVEEPVCPYGCRSWLSYFLSSAGTVWLDELSLVAA